MKSVRRHNAALRRTAFHEAGHAVAAIYFAFRLKGVSIEKDEWSLGRAIHVRLSDQQEAMVRDEHRLEHGLRNIVVSLAGGEAERLVGRRHDHVGARSDYATAADYALSLSAGIEAEASALLKYAVLRTRRLVSGEEWAARIAAIAAVLLERETLSGAEVRRLFYRLSS